MATPTKYQPFIYLAAVPNRTEPYKNTELYRFHVVAGSLDPVNGLEPYASGYDALAYRPDNGLLYGMDCAAPAKDTMVVIDPTNKKIETHKVTNVPRQGMPFVLGDITDDGKTYVAGGDANASSVDIDLTKEPPVAKANATPGPGGDYDWAFHPKDGRLYAVDGDNGSLLYFAPPEYKMAVLKEKAFPKADGPSETGISRPVYGAVFFSETGVLFAIDSAGNAYKVDLTKSEASKPIEAKDVPDYQSVGGGKIPLADKIRVIDAAGGYKDKIPIVYD